MAAYLFFGESGHLDFGPKGTRYFCVGTLTTRDPAALERALGALRDELLAEGVELEAFHAAEDRQAVRDRVFAALAAVGTGATPTRSGARTPALPWTRTCCTSRTGAS